MEEQGSRGSSVVPNDSSTLSSRASRSRISHENSHTGANGQANGNNRPRDDGLRHIIRAIKDGRVDNPFRYWTPQQVKAIASAFARSYNLADKEDLFLKAATILRNPDRDLRNDFDRDEQKALRQDRRGFWSQPKHFKVSIVTLCLAAVVQGWTETVSNGANLQWPIEFGLCSKTSCPSEDNVWIYAAVNAAPYLTASFVGCWLSDPISEYFLGRRAPIFLSALLILAGSIGSAATPKAAWGALLASRCIIGLGMGCKATVVSVFAAEIAPAHIRGTLVANWQLFVALGICLGFTANIAVSQVGATAWRWQTASLCFPSALLLILIYLCPDSPRYQMKHSAQHRGQRLRRAKSAISFWFRDVGNACFGLGRTEKQENDSEAGNVHQENAQDYTEAFRTFLELRGHPLLAAKELLYIHVQLVIESWSIRAGRLSELEKVVADAAASANVNEDDMLQIWLHSAANYPISYWHKLRDLWTVPRIRRATGSAIVVMLSQQLVGVNLLTFYSSSLYSWNRNHGAQPSLNFKKPLQLGPLWLSWGIGVTNFVCGIPSYWLIENPGRRRILLITVPLLACCMIGVLGGYQLKSHRLRLIEPFITLFMIFYSVGIGPVAFTHSSEVYPLEYRLCGMSQGVFVNLLGAGLLAFFVPILQHTPLHYWGLVAIFIGLNVLVWIFVALFVRETAGTGNKSKKAMSLEEITYIFDMKNSKYFEHQHKQVKWLINYALWPFNVVLSIARGQQRPQVPLRPVINYDDDDDEVELQDRV